MDSFRNAAKAFIVNDGNVLLLKRRPNDAHKPGAWDIPGGRLEQGENPYTGLQREAMEETGLTISVGTPLDVHHFTRDDGQQITLMIFLCTTNDSEVTLSEEHTEYKWVSVNSSKSEFPEWLHKVIDRYNMHYVS